MINNTNTPVTYLIKLGELTLKGSNIKEFEKRLVHNAQLYLEGVKARVQLRSGRMYIECPEESSEYDKNEMLYDLSPRNVFTPTDKMPLFTNDHLFKYSSVQSMFYQVPSSPQVSPSYYQEKLIHKNPQISVASFIDSTRLCYSGIIANNFREFSNFSEAVNDFNNAAVPSTMMVESTRPRMIFHIEKISKL